MAFTDAIRSGSSGGDAATVRLVADTGEFNAKVEAAERQWRDSTGQMSREALKLDLAQDRLRKSLASYGAESAQAKRATIALKDAEEQAARAADRQTKETRELDRAQEQASRSAGRMARGALAGSTAFGGFGRSIAFASTAFLGGAGFVYALRSTIGAAVDAERVQAKLQTAVENAGLSWRENAAAIDLAIKKHSQLSGIDDEELSESFANMLRTTKNVNEALRLNAIAADISRTKGTSLAAAQSLVARVYLGAYMGLKRLGVAFEPVTRAQDELRASGIKYTKSQMDAAKATDALASRQKAIAALQANFAKQAENYGNTAAGAQDRFRVAVENAQEVIGGAFLPTMTDLLNRAADWINKAEESGELQRKVNEYFKTGSEIVRGFVGALRLMADVLGPIVDALGGAENAAKLFLIAFAVHKIVGISNAVKGLRIAIGLLGPTSVRSAAISVTALNTIGTSATVNAGKVGTLRAALAGLGGISLGAVAATAGVMVGGAAVGLGAVKVLSELDEHLIQNSSQTKRANAERIATRWHKYGAGWLKTAYKNSDAEMKALIKKALLDHGDQEGLAVIGAGQTIVAPGEGRLGGPGGPPAPDTTTTPPGGGDTNARTEQDIQVDLARSRARSDEAGEARYLRELRGLYSRQIAALEKRKNLTVEQKAKLQMLYGQLGAVNSELAGISQAARQEAATREREEAQREKAAREAREKRIRDRLDARERRLTGAVDEAELSEKDLMDDKRALLRLRRFYGAQTQNDRLTLKERQEYNSKRRDVRRKLAELYKRAVDEAAEDEKITDRERRRLRALGGASLVRRAEREARRQAGKDGDGGGKGLTEADFRRLSFDFLSNLHGVVGQFGSNIGEGMPGGGGGEVRTHLWEQTQLLREQNKLLTDVSGSVRSPATRTARTELTATQWGVGF
jgi:hypothetical protein